MTEHERYRLECMDPNPMLEFLRGKASDRKLRLYAVACSSQVWQLLAGLAESKGCEGGRNATRMGWQRKWKLILPDIVPGPLSAKGNFPHQTKFQGPGLRRVLPGRQSRMRGIAADGASTHSASALSLDELPQDRMWQANLLREIVGRNHFRSVTFDPAALAQRYRHRKRFTPTAAYRRPADPGRRPRR